MTTTLAHPVCDQLCRAGLQRGCNLGCCSRPDRAVSRCSPIVGSDRIDDGSRTRRARRDGAVATAAGRALCRCRAISARSGLLRHRPRRRRCVLLMDAYLQHPVVVPRWSRLGRGADMSARARVRRRSGSSASHRGLLRLAQQPAVADPVDAGELRLMDRRVVEALKSLPEPTAS